MSMRRRIVSCNQRLAALFLFGLSGCFRPVNSEVHLADGTQESDSVRAESHDFRDNAPEVVSRNESPDEMPLSGNFKRLMAPVTGRTVVQLTSGKAFCYPLYYFIPSITKDAKYLIHHRAEDGQVQLYRLNLATGKSVQMTHADCPETQWRHWCVESGRGVLDHRSVLNVPRGLVIYFNGNRVRSVDVETLQDELLFVMSEDREPIGQNCTTPDGNWLVYIDAPRGSARPQPCRGAKVAAYNFDTEEHRVLAEIDVAIHHVVAYDNEHFIFCHPPGHNGMMMTDLTSGKYVHLREGDPGARAYLCHFLVTRRGIAYEVPGLKLSGLYDPFTRRRFEFKMPAHFGYAHTGRDPEGRLWFYESAVRRGPHDMYALVRLDDGDEWLRLTGHWPTYGRGQKSHFHPQLTPDRAWILFTAGDPTTETNHLFLLDVSDLRDTHGISPDLLSPTGANDRTRRRPPKHLADKALPVKSATAGKSDPEHPPKNVIDGDLTTFWAAEGDGEWIQCDLGERRTITQVLISWFSGDKRKERLEIAVSDNGTDWQTVFDGTSSGTTSGLEPFHIRQATARYVRIIGHGNTANRWNSMEEILILEE